MSKASRLVLVNRTDRSNETNKLTIKSMLDFKPHELEYLKVIVDAIMDSPESEFFYKMVFVK